MKLIPRVEKERLHALKKLHEQLAHPAQVKLEALIKNAGKWMASMKKELGTIYSQCKTCKVLAKTPAQSDGQWLLCQGHPHSMRS